jgi:hypothetical protein
VGGRLAAFAGVLLDPGGTPAIVAETVRRDEPDGTALVAAVLADSLRRSAEALIREVDLDGHVTDPHLHPVTQTFPPDLRTDSLHVARVDWPRRAVCRRETDVGQTVRGRTRARAGRK